MCSPYSDCNFSSRTILCVRNQSKGHGRADFWRADFCKDMDVMWLRNPFPKLDRGDGEDLLISSDKFNGGARD